MLQIKTLIIIYFATIQIFGAVESLNMECKYDFTITWILSSHYRCIVQNNLNINSKESESVTSASGLHQSSNANNDVGELYISDKKTKFFPKGIEKVFAHLNVIRIHYGQLIELEQTDLMPFSNLIELHLGGNDIEVLEDGLFDFNTGLQVLTLDLNKISHIDAGVFDHITLKYFYLSTCVTKNVPDNITGVQQIINEAKIKCVDPFFQNLNEKLKTLENESKELDVNSENLQRFEEKIENFKAEIESSKFKNFKIFKKGIEFLMDRNTNATSNLNSISSSSEEKSNQLKDCCKIVQKTEELIKNPCLERDDSFNENESGLKAQENNELELIRDELKELKRTLEKMDPKIEMIQTDLVKKLEEIFENKLGNMKFVTKIEL